MQHLQKTWGVGLLLLTRNPKKDCNPDRSSADDRSTRPLSEKHLLHPVTPHSLLVTLLLHCFVASPSHSKNSSHAESSRRSSPQWSAPYPPACPALPGLRPCRLPANTPKSARTPANDPWSPIANRGRIHGLR